VEISGAPMANMELLGRLAVALAVGLLIGLERGWERRELPEGHRAAGLRTFGIIGLLGGLSAQLGGNSGMVFPAVVVAALGLLAALGYWRESSVDNDVSLTSAATMLVTFCLGAFAGRGELTVAASAAVVIALLLGFKPELHGLIRHIERAELLATLRLLLISVVLLPVLPNRGFGPWDAFNPYQIWWMVVLVAGVSYVGYFAIKLLGKKRGVFVTGLCGGLISSTAVALDLARLSRDERELAPDALAAGATVASAMMFPRMLAVIAVAAPMLAYRLAEPLILACAVSFLAAMWLVRRDTKADLPENAQHPEPSNPLDLNTAVKFGLMLATIMVLARGATARMGDQGLYLLSALSGLVDVDAISLSAASMMSQGQISIGVAANAVLIAATVNTLLKAALVLTVGGARMGWRVSIASVATLAAGGAGLWVLVAAS
jgi:uncharacterized membrane protein (DUF4010 family)